MQAFIAEVVKKLPVPYAYEASGRIRKRVILRFKCARGTEPDFVYETAAWSKWLRVGLCALTAGKSIITGDILGGVDGLSNMFDALKRKDLDAELTFKTLVEEPFLTSGEQDELLENLREKGFFKAFEYDSNNATWYRKEARHLVPAESKLEEKPVAKSRTAQAPAAAPAATRGPTVAAAAKSSTGPQSSVEYSSWLTKVGQLMPSKKRRWFVLKNQRISYYEDSSLAVRKGEFPVSAITSVSSLDGENWFVVKTLPTVHGGEFRLQVESEADYSGWRDAIQRAK